MGTSILNLVFSSNYGHILTATDPTHPRNCELGLQSILKRVFYDQEVLLYVVDAEVRSRRFFCLQHLTVHLMCPLALTGASVMR